MQKAGEKPDLVKEKQRRNDNKKKKDASQWGLMLMFKSVTRLKQLVSRG